MGFADLSDALRSRKIDAAFVWDRGGELCREGTGTRDRETPGLTMVIPMRDEFKRLIPRLLRFLARAQRRRLCLPPATMIP
jgi:hypothetical protein